MAQPLLLLRADASPQHGTGHVMRCLALAQAWQDAGGRAMLAAAELPPALAQRLAAEGVDVTRLTAMGGSADDAQTTVDLAGTTDAAWVVLDGYHLGTPMQRAVKAAGRRLLCIDDYGHAGAYVADLVLNQNLGATAEPYAHRATDTELLLGTRFVLLRREFQAWRTWQRSVALQARRLLVTLGGADPDNVTGRVVETLVALGDDSFEAEVLVGGSFPHLEQLHGLVAGHEDRIKLRANITDMPACMAAADLAIAAGGTTTWERAFMGLPSMTVILADNQIPLAEAAADAGFAVNLGWGRDLNPGHLAMALQSLRNDRATRERMAERGRATVDGRGAERVVQRMLAAMLSLRPATPEDCRRVWEWANDPIARSVSFHSALIPWEDHVRWFSQKLADPASRFLIATDHQGVPIGTSRCDERDGRGVISVNLAPAARGRGLGTQLIRRTCMLAWQGFQFNVIDAYIKPGNQASILAFSQAGFAPAGSTTIQEAQALRYVAHRPAHLPPG
jgi:UDP-2,4-diacetamido-2,4,6-trideoxy-beta-L-altropyranose hydrolase